MRTAINLLLSFLVSFSVAHAQRESLGDILQSKPRISIITSVYKGDAFIRDFLEDIVRQTIFSECELIIINANSPENEEPIILEHCKQYPNIIYVRLAKDPGLYAVWNMGTQMARADFIANANIDDHRNPEILEMHARALEENPGVDVVYSDFYISETPNRRFEDSDKCYLLSKGEFSLSNAWQCQPGPFPMWRKSLHDKFGYFDENYKSGGDWDFWCRIIHKGVKFKRVPGISGTFYGNPTGLSSTQQANKEWLYLTEKYKYLWEEWPKKYEQYLPVRKAKQKRTELA